MPPQQHLYSGLARLAHYSIFAREWIGLARMRGWLVASVGHHDGQRGASSKLADVGV